MRAPRNLKQQLDGEIFELLFSLTDFVTFKEVMLDYKAYKEGSFQDITSGITVQRITETDSPYEL